MTVSAVAVLVVSAVALLCTVSASALVLDPTFGTAGITTVAAGKGFSGTAASRAVARPDGGYIVAGSSTTDGYYEDTWMVTAFNADGRIDHGFGRNGRAMLPKKFGSRQLQYSPASAVAIQPDGKIVVGSTVDVATHSDYRAYDREFGDPECNCTASRAAFAILRLTPRGRIDRTYGKHGLTLIRSVVRTWDEGLNAELADLAIDANGGAVVYGNSTDVTGAGGWAGTPYGLIYKLSPRGRIDKSFGTRGRLLEAYPKATDESSASTIGVDATGALTTVTELTVIVNKKNYEPRWQLRKYSPTGALVSSYGVMGVREIGFVNPGGASLVEAAFAPDGSVTLAGSLKGPRDSGSTDQPPPYVQSIVARVTADGAIDASFGTGGVELVDPPTGAQTTLLLAMSRRSDGTIDLAELYTPATPAGQDQTPDDVVAIRSLSSTGQLIPDGSGQTTKPVPGLGHRYKFYVSGIFTTGSATTLIGDRESLLVGSENRITLMRLLP